MANAMTMPTGQYGARHIARLSVSVLHAKPLNAATGRVPATYRPGGRHGHRCRRRRDENTTHN
jgi:hypothetical protein